MSRFDYETVVRGALAIVVLRGELDLPATAALEPELARHPPNLFERLLQPLKLAVFHAPIVNRKP